MKFISTSSLPPAFHHTEFKFNFSCATQILILAKKSTSKSPQQNPSPKGAERAAPRITSNVKQNLKCLKLWKDYQRKKSNTAKPTTNYRRKREEKKEMPDDTDVCQDPTLTLYYTNQGLEIARPVLLVDGYNVCGYWPKLKKYFMGGRLDIVRQKLIDELVDNNGVRPIPEGKAHKRKIDPRESEDVVNKRQKSWQQFQEKGRTKKQPRQRDPQHK